VVAPESAVMASGLVTSSRPRWRSSAKMVTALTLALASAQLHIQSTV
jgi:hypothetical protein